MTDAPPAGYASRGRRAFRPTVSLRHLRTEPGTAWSPGTSNSPAPWDSFLASSLQRQTTEQRANCPGGKRGRDAVRTLPSLPAWDGRPGYQAPQSAQLPARRLLCLASSHVPPGRGMWADRATPARPQAGLQPPTPSPCLLEARDLSRVRNLPRSVLQVDTLATSLLIPVKQQLPCAAKYL